MLSAENSRHTPIDLNSVRYIGASPETSEHADAVTSHEPRVGADAVRFIVDVAACSIVCAAACSTVGAAVRSIVGAATRAATRAAIGAAIRPTVGVVARPIIGAVTRIETELIPKSDSEFGREFER